MLEKWWWKWPVPSWEILKEKVEVIFTKSASPYKKKIEDMALTSTAAQSSVISGYAYERSTNGQGLSQELASSIQETFLEFGFID